MTEMPLKMPTADLFNSLNFVFNSYLIHWKVHFKIEDENPQLEIFLHQ